jgi:hypothetical protein
MAPSGWALLGQIGREMGGNELIGTSLGQKSLSLAGDCKAYSLNEKPSVRPIHQHYMIHFPPHANYPSNDALKGASS